MVQSRSWYYRSPSSDNFEGINTKDFEPLVDSYEAFQSNSTLDTTIQLRVFNVGTFDNMKDDHHGSVHNRFSNHVRGISSPDWKLQLHTWSRKSAKGHPILMSGISLTFYLSIWNKKRSKFMNTRPRSIRSTCVWWSTIERTGWN